MFFYIFGVISLSLAIILDVLNKVNDFEIIKLYLFSIAYLVLAIHNRKGKECETI